MIRKYKATVIGLYFTVCGFLLYYTFVVPFLITLPLSLLLEIIFKNPDYSKTGQGVICSLAILFVLLSILFFVAFIRQIRRNEDYSLRYVILYFILLQFVVHPLVFYIDLSEDWSRAGDGQFFLSVGETFQLSSLPFLIPGIVIDGLKVCLQKPIRNNS